jgi:ankyrin repeat protein
MDSEVIWRSAEDAVITGDVATLDRLLREHENMFRDQRPPSYGSGGLRPDYSGGDARSILVRNHAFDNWAAFAECMNASRLRNSVIGQFEAAADAIVSGDAAALETLLRENPELIRARSTRRHHAMLLHYVGANGLEYFRQKTPPNIVAITEVLVNAGAEIDAIADVGGSTALGLAATSIHPAIAGVQIPLLETLLQAGAAVDGPAGAPALLACLANGRGEAAEFLASRGARLDLEGAAGVGRVDVVESYFQQDGTLKGNATKAQMLDGFTWACEYGRLGVVDFLLKKGLDVSAKGRPHGQTGLHWAAYGGHLDVVKLLLERGAPVDPRDESFLDNPLGWALYAWGNPIEEPGDRRYHEVVALLVAAGAQVNPGWLAGTSAEIQADPLMLGALRGETPLE